MIPRPLQDIRQADIVSLWRNEVSEGRTLDYKLTLPGDSNDDKSEFLADVTSLANSQGGDLIFGVDEAKGVPVSAPGIDPPDLDAALLRLENLMRDKIDPRLAGARFHWAPRTEGGGIWSCAYPPAFRRRTATPSTIASTGATAVGSTRWTPTNSDLPSQHPKGFQPDCAKCTTGPPPRRPSACSRALRLACR